MILGPTKSVCPICLRQVEARRVRRGDDVFLQKTCPEHGDFSAIIWRGMDDAFVNWLEDTARDVAVPSSCPTTCATCEEHLTKTCCALVEITSRCNLRCPICFADAGDASSEPTVDELERIFAKLVADGNTFVQLSGGEPTVRDDLPEIIAAARYVGVETVQLNSNGLRLAAEPEFTKMLASAGLSFVFLQFDGVSDSIYEKLRGEPLWAQKQRCIKVCGEAGLGVTLVPTVTPGVNVAEIGAILDFAVAHSPVVRGVHFQPISYFGRYPSPPRDEDRITLPEVLRAVEAQAKGRIKIRDFNPSSCDHPRCGFHGDFVVLPKGKLMKLTQKYNPDACCCDDAHLKNRNFVARRWTRDNAAELETAANATDEALAEADAPEMSAFLRRVKSHGFTVSAMAFQDAYTLDLERLMQCSLHVLSDGAVVPFCANYLSNVEVPVKREGSATPVKVKVRRAK